MIKKGLKLHSILFGSCPKCHEESMYIKTKAYTLTDTLLMHEKCSNCGFKYQIEPSFFYGSMYISYAVSIVFAVAAFIISHIVLKSSLTMAFIAIVLTLIGLMPIIMRLSRNIWINLFVSYDKTKRKLKFN